MWGKSKDHKEQWLNDLKHHLWKSIGMVGPDPNTPQGAAAYSTKNDDDEGLRHMMKDVSLRDRRPSDPQQPRAQQGGRTSAGAGASGSSRPPQQQQAADYGDEEFEQWADDGEAEGDEQWSDTHGGHKCVSRLRAIMCIVAVCYLA
jgi:hypothetical protein